MCGIPQKIIGIYWSCNIDNHFIRWSDVATRRYNLLDRVQERVVIYSTLGEYDLLHYLESNGKGQYIHKFNALHKVVRDAIVDIHRSFIFCDTDITDYINEASTKNPEDFLISMGYVDIAMQYLKDVVEFKNNAKLQFNK